MKLFKILLLALLVIFAVVGSVWCFWYRSGALRQTVVDQISKQAEKVIIISSSTASSVDVLQDFLGFNTPRYYLLLFLNNTELRPGGGFIGSYAVVKMDKGAPEIIIMEGTEILDYSQPDFDLPAPPKPLMDYLKLQKWYFRDSNWSPDFAVSAQQSLDLYKKEKGARADEINAVIGFTPAIISELLKITGPVQAGGMEFNSDNLVEKLEYEVEYGYLEKGIEKRDRKDLLGDLARALMGKIKFDVIWRGDKYFSLWQKMIDQKQMMIFALSSSTQAIVRAQDWAGEMSSNQGDYLFWVDANLGALKTDLAVKKEIFYDLTPTTSGFIAQVTMKYIHSGKLDWRTSRYRTYARLYVPAGSKLISAAGAMKGDRDDRAGVIDQGVENGRQWFGAFISIEPGQTKQLSFQYLLSAAVVDLIKIGQYNLLAQKQLGSVNNQLTLRLDFGRPVVSAGPPEAQAKFGDDCYDMTTDLVVDREFNVKL